MPTTPSAKRILLVEDNEDDAELARLLFEKCGVLQDVEFIRDGAEALDFVFGSGRYGGIPASDSLKLIILDLNIPKISGMEILQRLREDPRSKNIPVVALTVTGRERDVLEKEPYNVMHYFRKPLELHSFLTIYRQYVENK